MSAAPVWPLVQEIYAELTGGGSLPETMPPRERRQVDAILVVGGEARILEVDETQHFNRFRALTLRRYNGQIPLAFPAADWIAACEAKKRLEGGGFGKPRPPLFPRDGGRHQQRAFRDALADFCPASTDGCRPCASPTSRSLPGSTDRTRNHPCARFLPRACRTGMPVKSAGPAGPRTVATQRG